MFLKLKWEACIPTLSNSRSLEKYIARTISIMEEKANKNVRLLCLQLGTQVCLKKGACYPEDDNTTGMV